MLDTLEIPLLRTFITVLDTKTLTEAAGRLNVSQPAVSQQLDRLESAVGQALFISGSRRQKLTRLGTRLAEHARNLLRIHDDIRREIDQPELAGGVTLGTPDLYAASLLPEIIAEFGRFYPEVRINLRCALSAQLLNELQHGEIDLALITKMPDVVSGTTVRHEQLVWVTSPAFTAHKSRPLPLAMLPPGNYYRDIALEALGRHDIKWIETCYSENISGLEAAVRSGLGVTVLAKSALESLSPQLTRAEGLPELPKIELVLQRGHNAASPSVDKLAKFILEKLAE